MTFKITTNETWMKKDDYEENIYYTDADNIDEALHKVNHYLEQKRTVRRNIMFEVKKIEILQRVSIIK